MANSILVVDDSPNIRLTLKDLLTDEGYRVQTVETGEAALQQISEEHFDAMLLDIKLPGMDGLATLKKIGQIQPALKVIMISGQADFQTAVQATKLGAYNFLEKPLQPEKVLLELKNIFDRQKMETEMRRLKNIVDLDYQMIGTSPAMQVLRREIELAAPSEGRILIYGENGTGKELVAREIHRKSLRADKPFVKVNCAAIPKELIESELFGHQKGAFTGAISSKIGVFEEANGGTLLLDEIGDMALETQAKLLRVLQENEFIRVGGTQAIPFDVRIITATNKDLKKLIADNLFREDLFFRINVIPIRVPPLSLRKADVPLLVHHFITAYCQKNGKPIKEITEEALLPLMNYHWPGNIRELKNVIERLVIMSDNSVLTIQNVKALLPEIANAPENKILMQTNQAEVNETLSLKEQMEHFENQLLQYYYLKLNGNVTRVAEKLKTDRANLHRKLKKYGIH